ncbi:hypothetical protein PoB_003297600 [Plakobranchus ocellatus]|uniref:CCHC-type domain-containing protein n=1 Tax=Plakobranchus ocellatus TaxID=259542 RepID=A0AAV4ADN1_9GAST|nr:hypothetical protein PoB_003297600 [Plakobranchus ocellatus]
MAEANVNIASQLQSIANSLISQQAAANVPTFEGREKSINNWLEELDKLQRVYGLTDESVKTLAWTRAKGTVSSFLGRIMQESPLLAGALVKRSWRRCLISGWPSAGFWDNILAVPSRQISRMSAPQEADRRLKRCFVCHKPGHIMRDCPQRGGRSNQQSLPQPATTLIGRRQVPEK